ncbi:DUF6616 family protein [Xanthobacter sp. TB0139]|uniref:DUF6616 family protein n=1 Tax=Xanthobacter sp. TB0139 TaxID=3459178 RepID=UPI004039B8D8
MSHMLIELYTPRAAWLALDEAARQAFFARIGAGMEGLLGRGITPMAFGAVDDAMAHGAPQRFFAIWQAPDAAGLKALLEGIALSGWHDYFDTLNAGGVAEDLPAHLQALAAARI